MAKRDYYEVLGISKSASAEDIKKAYRKLTMKYHPDRSKEPGAEAKYKEINEAAEVLRDPKKRAQYDRFGHNAFSQSSQGTGGFQQGDFGGFEGFADVFEDLFGSFGGGRRQSQQRRGSDLQYNLEISLEEAFKGANTTIKVPTTVACDACSGSGAKAGTAPITCPACQGRGKVGVRQGFFVMEQSCASCQGSGQKIVNPCPKCNATGRKAKTREFKITIPAGVEEGMNMRIASAGEAGMRGAAAGDLYVYFGIRQHKFFTRENANLFAQVTVPMTTAALGGSLEVPSIDGEKLRITVPEGSQSGKLFRLRSKGMSVHNSQRRGDMIIELNVKTPRNLTKKQRELLEEFRKLSGDEASNIFSRVKDHFAG